MSNTETINSREIAEFTGKRHAAVMRDIRNMFAQLGLNNLKYKSTYITEQNKAAPCYNLPRREADLLVTGYAPDVRAKIIDRWHQADNAMAAQHGQPVVLTVPTISVSTGVTEVKVAKPREVKSGRYDVPYGNPPAVIEQQGDELTMSSVEIAALTGKRHDHVLADIQKMLGQLDSEDDPKFRGIYFDAYRREQRCFNLPRRETDILLTGYSVPLRAKVIDRWHQLEAEVAKPTFSVPTSFAEALRLAGELEEQRVALTHQVGVQAAKIEQDKPKVKVFTKLIEQKDVISFQKFCTQLNLHQRKVKAWLRDIGWLRADQWEVNPLPTAKAVDAGYCDIKRFETVNGTLKQQIVFTGKAEAYVELKAPDYIRKPVRKERKKAA